MINQKLFIELDEAGTPARDEIEPGLLPAFRLFVGFQIVVLCIGLVIAKFARPELNFLIIGLLSLPWMLLLFGYLSMPSLQSHLGRAYLPIALAAVTLTPIVQRAVFFAWRNQADVSFTAAEIANSSWHLLVSLLVPLVFIAWQYHFRAVVYFTIAIFAMLLALPLWAFGIHDRRWLDVIDLSLSSAVSFMLIGYIITKLVDAQRARQQVLARMNEQLIDHAATVEQLAISHERNRLARDLHDTLAHTLSSVSVQLEAVDSSWEQSPDQARELLRKSLGNARSGLAETRRALRALRATPVEDLGIVLAVRTLAESTAARQGLRLKVDLPDALMLPPELEQNIYRIAQEALTNVTRHADAQTLYVGLHKEDEQITLKIVDDGKGFVTAKGPAAEHFGLQGMRERAEMIDGTLDVQSEPGQGTTVRLQLNRREGGQS